MKSKIITIAGSLGSGKTSTSNKLAQELGYKRFSAGDFQRATAASLGLTYDEYQKLAEQDPQYDLKADTALREAGDGTDSVIDARLGYHFIPQSYKVFLFLDPKIAAERILKDAEVNPARHKETLQGATDPDTIAKGIEARYESEKVRYRKHYGIEDYYDPSHFDIVVDTSQHPLDDVVQLIIDNYQLWLDS